MSFFCAHCGKAIADVDQFCRYCGGKVGSPRAQGGVFYGQRPHNEQQHSSKLVLEIERNPFKLKPGCCMIFPEGGLSIMTQSGLKVFGSTLGHAGGFVMEHAGKLQEVIHKSLVGGSSIPGSLRLYDDHLEFDPYIPKALMPLYRGIDNVSLGYDQIVSVEVKKVKTIFNIVDLELRAGHCRLQPASTSSAEEIGRVLKAQLAMGPRPWVVHSDS